MLEIDSKLNLITEIWNFYILELGYFQSKINYQEQVNSNFYGEVMHYFFDTFDILDNHENYSNRDGSFSEKIFYLVGYLQVLYVHQDLVDEMLRIFKISESNSIEKRLIREIRNELIGHPISRNSKNKELISSVFWRESIGFNSISYLKYNNKIESSVEYLDYKVTDLIEKHKQYLKHHFNQILNKQLMLVKDYDGKIKQINNLLLLNPYSNKLPVMVSQYIEFIENYSMFSYEKVVRALEQYALSNRYKYFYENYLSEVKNSILEISNKNQEMIIKINIELGNKSDSIGDIEFDLYQNESRDKCNIIELSNNIYSYYFSKLSEMKYLESIDIIKKAFEGNLELLTELERMQEKTNDEFEYYCSFIYAKHLVMKTFNVT